jgi:PAS domain S-box-containing protein
LQAGFEGSGLAADQAACVTHSGSALERTVVGIRIAAATIGRLVHACPSLDNGDAAAMLPSQYPPRCSSSHRAEIDPMDHWRKDWLHQGDRQAVHSVNQRIFETSLDLILVVDRQGNFIRVSPSSLTILGYRPDELIGRSAIDFVHVDDLDSTRNEMRLARRGQLTRNFDCRYVHKDGRVVPLAWTGVWSEPDQQHFFIGRDMTEHIKLERQLRQAQKMEAIGQLTGGIAHDFNNILCVIIGETELLAGELAPDPRLLAMVRSIDEAAVRGSQLTQRMLAFARKQPLQSRACNLDEIVTRMTRLLQRTLGEDIAVTSAVPENQWPAVVDPSQLEDAILNLAVNARDAMPRGGRLLIETANVHLDEQYASQNVEVTAGDYAAIIVTDSGAGMSADVIEHAFEPFFTTKEVGQGTGLGLSMVYGFVKQSGGHVKIYSEVGHGTSVRLYLPRADTAAKDTRAAEVATRAPGSCGETILVVEDDPAVRAMAVTLLDTLGYRVLQAEDGNAALSMLRESPAIDLLFTDLIMPNGMSGHELLRMAREHRPGLRALFTSGYSRQFIEGRGETDLDTPLLGKPYRKQKLADAIRGALDGRPA